MADSNFDIWRLQSTSDIRGLIDAVREGDADVRRRAITAIRVLGATSAIPGLQSILVEEKDSEIRDMLIATLDYLFQQEVDEDDEQTTGQHNQVVHLIAQLNSENPEQVIRAAQNLGELKEKIATESLVIIFHNRGLRADVRLAAAEALIKLESAPVEVSLLAVLRHSDWHHRRNAAAVLGQLSADWAVRPLTLLLHDEQEIVRRTAFAALKRIGTAEALRVVQPPETQSAGRLVQPESVSPATPTFAPEPIPDTTAATLTQSEVKVDTTTTSSESDASTPVIAADSPDSLPASPTSPSLLFLEVGAPVDDEDTQPSPPTVLPDDVT